MAGQQQPDVEAFVPALLKVNRTLLERFVDLLERLQESLLGNPDELQGEFEDRLRLTRAGPGGIRSTPSSCSRRLVASCIRQANRRPERRPTDQPFYPCPV